METPAEIRERWSHLRGLLIEQLDRLETGALRVHTRDGDANVDAIDKLKRHIQDFDELIARNEARNR